MRQDGRFLHGVFSRFLFPTVLSVLGGTVNVMVDSAIVGNMMGAQALADVYKRQTADRMLMRNISFSVRPGQKVAIVGSTGAGKTTLINLLMRFYEVNGGKILLSLIHISLRY